MCSGIVAGVQGPWGRSPPSASSTRWRAPPPAGPCVPRPNARSSRLVTEPLSQPLVPLPRQKRVLERLQLVGPGPAAFYADALRMLRSGDSLECLTHLVSHCHREIESALKDVLLPDGLPKEEREQGQKSKDTHKREVQAVLAALRIDESESLAKLWLRIATREDEDALHRAAHRNALDAPRPFDAAFRTRCSELEALFDLLLDRFEADFPRHLQLVDDLALTPQPTNKEVKRLRSVVPNNRVTMGRFFSRIDARWVTPLREGGCFAAAPANRSWEASAYLARVAAVADDATRTVIAAVASELPDTDNPWVNRDLAKIALVVTTDVAERLAPRLAPKLPTTAGGFAEDLAALAERLAGEGRIAAAVDLVRALVALEDEGGNDGG